jgi:hypothetical protein
MTFHFLTVVLVWPDLQSGLGLFALARLTLEDVSLFCYVFRLP